jgi:hypothetical protein
MAHFLSSCGDAEECEAETNQENSPVIEQTNKIN